jgi:GT2 family glycosyltransferase
MLSICVPSWNSLEYLKILVRSIRRNTKVPYEIIVHDNGSDDNTALYCKSENILFSRSPNNLGFTGVNTALRAAAFEYTVIMNTDMYVLPDWDTAIVNQINKFKEQGIDKFTISSCLIEPVGNNPEYTIFNSGHSSGTFHEVLLLGNFLKSREAWKKPNTNQYSHPILLPTKMLREMNYLDEEYFPGWAVDHDLAASAYKAGCRNFVMLGDSRVYHFSSKTFQKLPNEIRNQHGQDIFQRKWGMTVDEFRKRLGVKLPFEKVGENVLNT